MIANPWLIACPIDGHKKPHLSTNMSLAHAAYPAGIGRLLLDSKRHILQLHWNTWEGPAHPEQLLPQASAFARTHLRLPVPITLQWIAVTTPQELPEWYIGVNRDEHLHVTIIHTHTPREFRHYQIIPTANQPILNASRGYYVDRETDDGPTESRSAFMARGCLRDIDRVRRKLQNPGDYPDGDSESTLLHPRLESRL